MLKGSQVYLIDLHYYNCNLQIEVNFIKRRVIQGMFFLAHTQQSKAACHKHKVKEDVCEWATRQIQ